MAMNKSILKLAVSAALLGASLCAHAGAEVGQVTLGAGVMGTDTDVPGWREPLWDDSACQCASRGDSSWSPTSIPRRRASPPRISTTPATSPPDEMMASL